MLALAHGCGVGNFVDLEPIHAAFVGEDQQVAVGGRHDQVLKEILGARAHADAALAAARLPAIGIDGRALQIAAVRDGDRHIFDGHQIFQPDLAGVFDDLGAALVAIQLAHFLQLFDHELAHQFLGAQQFQVSGDAPLDFSQLVGDLLLLHAGEALQLQLDDGLRLALGELEGGDQRIAGLAGGARGANHADHFVQVLQRFLESEQQMLALAGLAQLKVGAPPDHFHAVLDEVLDAIDQAQFARLPVDDRKHDHAEADLQLRVLVKVVEDDFSLLAAFQLKHDTGAVAVAFVADFGYAFDLLLVDQRGGILDEARFVHLVGDFGDDDVLAIFTAGFDGGLGAQFKLAAAFGEGVDDALTAEDEAAGGEIGAGNHLQNFGERRLRILDERDGGVDDFSQIVRRNVGGHAHGDAG